MLFGRILRHRRPTSTARSASTAARRHQPIPLRIVMAQHLIELGQPLLLRLAVRVARLAPDALVHVPVLVARPEIVEAALLLLAGGQLRDDAHALLRGRRATLGQVGATLSPLVALGEQLGATRARQLHPIGDGEAGWRLGGQGSRGWCGLVGGGIIGAFG